MPGPFDADPAAVGRLGPAFASFVNDLVDAERAAARITGFTLEVNRQTNTPDGGVDAALRRATGTSWLPDGDSAWQFKSWDLEPEECRQELRRADWAQVMMRSGATYVLVLGRPLVDEPKQRRREALVEESLALGLPNPDLVRVYDGNQLARWISTIPSLALDRRLNGPGPVVLDYDRWVDSRDHQTQWSDCPSRAEIGDAIRGVATGDVAVYRVEGGSGLGKTRLVMEDSGIHELRHLVAYAPRADQVTAELLAFLQSPERICVLVVDECTRANHNTISEQLASNAGVRLITIGEGGSDRIVVHPVHSLAPATDDEIESILLVNVPSLWPEARRIAKTSCFGNIKTALLIGGKLVEAGETAVADLLRHQDVRGVILALLPEHADFFAAAVLALFERIGWDRDRRHQLQALAHFAGLDPGVLGSTAGALESAGLLTRLGRYRAVTPQPFAVFLAADCWEREGERILNELVPMCDREMLDALFTRCADLGTFGPVQSVMSRLLGSSGPFASLEQIESGELGGLLIQLAIILPERTVDQLSELIENASLASLRQQTGSRRSLVWSLEKLVWHEETFERAADAMLRLALAENETWANNATSQWISLFGARLPTTAARPEQRVSYLLSRVRSEDPIVRSLAVRAASAALHPFESAMVSGELQGGAIVAPRGTVGPGGEALQYWVDLVQLLDRAVSDEDDTVLVEAQDGLIAAMHPFIDVPEVGPALTQVLLRFRGEALKRLRRSIEQLLKIADEPVRAALVALEGGLPRPSPLERLHELLKLEPWAWEPADDRTSETADLLTIARQGGQLDEVLHWLESEDLPSAWHLGAALASLPESEQFEPRLIAGGSRTQLALGGYLYELVQRGATDSFDLLLDSADGQRLSPDERLYLTTVGPRSPVAWQRVFTLLSTVSVQEGVTRVIRWHDELSPEDLTRIIGDWKSRLTTDREYAAIIDFLNLATMRTDEAAAADLVSMTMALLALRTEHSALGTERWDWCQLAKGLAPAYPVDIAKLILEQVSNGSLLMLDADDEAQILRTCAGAAPTDIWELVATRLENGDWRLMMVLRGWFTTAIPLNVLQAWIGESLPRARQVAGIAAAGNERPTDLAVYLLDRFGEDDEVAGALHGEFQSGGWVGPWSERVRTQIRQLTGWRRDIELPSAVRVWAGQGVDALEQELAATLEREAEDMR